MVSTTWDRTPRKIKTPPQANVHERAKASTLWGLLAWPRRKPLTLTVKYRGGACAWYEIRTRGRTIRRPGSITLHDLMREVYADFLP